MDEGDFMAQISAFWAGNSGWDKPLAFIDLARGGEIPDDLVLPPCPVIGLGKGAASLAASLDAVAEPPVPRELLEKQILANPNAAAVIAQLLRIVASLSPEAGLTAESFAYGLLQGSAEHTAWKAKNTGAGSPPAEAGRVLCERAGNRLSIMLDRPAQGNAIDQPMRDSLYEALHLGAIDTSIEQVRLTAAGKTFSLGAALGEFGTTGDPATAHAIRCMTLPARMALRCAPKLEVHVQGGCVGAGLEIAAFARRITASPTAWFQLPELAMGILPGAGGCVSLVNRIGRQRAALMILSGKRISARHALDWGLIEAIVDDPA